jgi:hypothetical protein
VNTHKLNSMCCHGTGFRKTDEIIAPITGCLSFHRMAQCDVYALKGLACRARVTPASSPALHCKQCSALMSPSLNAAAPGLHALAEVT